jgi:CAAX protease family protein
MGWEPGHVPRTQVPALFDPFREVVMSLAVSALPRSRPQPVASWRHTLTIFIVFFALALAGTLFQHRSASAPPVTAHPNVIPLYLQLFVMEWGLFLFVWQRGLKTTGTTLRELIGGRWASPRDVLADLAIASLLLGSWWPVDLVLSRVMGPGHAAPVTAYLPRGALESILWIALSLSAGFCEEFVFRGYFQRQFAAWTGSRWIALLLQAALFGLLHAYQGFAAGLKIACFGALYGLVALKIRNLRPGMMAHAMTDILSGLSRI